MQRIHNQHFFGWKLLHNYEEAHNGRIWFMWKDTLQVSLVASSNQSITCRIVQDAKQFYFTAIYGSNDGMERRGLWSHLQTVSGTFMSNPWMLAGDFNVIAHPTESSYEHQQYSSGMRDFMDSRESLSVFDHAYTGPLMTWSNHQSEGFLARKLDRVLINDNWLSCFPSSSVEFLPPEVSDHCPGFVQLHQESSSSPKPFKFFNYWTKHARFLEVVEQSWRGEMIGNPLKILHYKMKRLKAEMREFNNAEFGNITGRVTVKRGELAAPQVLVLNSPANSNLVEQEKVLSNELNALVQAEESYFRQKSRISWIREGDQNTKFFQKIVNAQSNRFTIRSLKDAKGQVLTSFQQISNEDVTFFQNLLGTTDPNVEECPQDLLAEILQFRLPTDAGLDLEKPVTAEEIKTSMLGINGEKAPRPDGFTAHFFKAAWSIVGDDLSKAVQYFFQTTKLPSAFNSTAIALVPKCSNPNSIRDFRPISCCTVVYKCITRIMANRLKKYMPQMVSNSQSAFIPGRSISDNILMAQELVRGYGRSTLSPRCAIKIDLQKTFDTLDRRFILQVLTVMQFPSRYIGWIRSCITNPMFSISINGGLVGYFKGARGVRQRDPLSPYLFVIAMNVLSKLLDAAAKHGVFMYHPKCKKISLTHLCFADDLLIFSKGNLSSILGIQNVLNVFYAMSGLQLNCAKSELFSSGVGKGNLDEIQHVTGFKTGSLPVRYLGVPLVTRRLTDKDCRPLVERITSRINHWSAKLLSFAGRLQLVQTVLYTIQNYWCRQFLLPKSV